MPAKKGVIPRNAGKKGNTFALKLTPSVIDKYLSLVQTTGQIATSALAVGVSVGAIKSLRQRSSEFVERERLAKDLRLEELEAKVDVAAFDGVPEPIFQKGKRVGERLRLEPQLAILRLKALAPEKYRENKHEIEHTGGVIIAPAQLSPAEWQAKEEERMRKQLEDQRDAPRL